MQDIINLLLRVHSTMDTISVTGIDNQDKFVGCANAIQTAVSHLKQFEEQRQAGMKEDTSDG